MLEILVRASFEGAILVAMIWALCRCLPRLSPATRTVLWWCAAAKFVLALVWTAPVHVPILPASLASIQEARVPGTGKYVEGPEAAAPVSAGRITATSAATRAGRPPSRGNPQSAAAWQAVALVVAWMVGVAGAAGVGVRRWKQMAGLIARSGAAPPATEVMAAGLASRLGLRHVPRVRFSDEVGTPLVTGILQPIILLPAPAFEALSERQQRLALCHELTHIKRADLWLGCVPAIAERAFFFHPLVHLAAREYALCREAACDARVLAVLNAAPQEYGRLLLDLGVSRARTSLAAAGAPWSFSTLRRRIAMLDSPSPRSTGSRAVAAIVIGAAVLAIAPLRMAARPAAVDLTIDSAVQPPPADLHGVGLEPVTPPILPGTPPERAPVDGAAQKEHDLNYVLFIDGDRTTMSGSTRDIATARRYRRTGEPILWFRHGGREYVVRDQRILDQVTALWKPVNELGGKQGELGGRQGELGAKQGEIGARQGELGAEQGALGARQGALGARQGAMAAWDRRPQTEADRRAFDEERRQIDLEMRALDAQMRALDAKMREVEKPMQDLGRQMAVLGKEMEVLGRQMEEEARKAETGMRALLDRAVSTGAAEAVK
jgi:bla regulator protein blaR1